MGVSPRAKRVLRALPLSTPICYHQMLRTSRVFCYEIVTNQAWPFAKAKTSLLRCFFILCLRLRRGQHRMQGRKSAAFHPFCRTRRQSRNKHKGVRPPYQPPGGGTSSVVEAYTGLSHFFKAIEAKIAIQTLGQLSTKGNLSIIISTSIVHRASGGQHILRKEVCNMMKFLMMLFALLREFKSVTITIKK